MQINTFAPQPLADILAFINKIISAKNQHVLAFTEATFWDSIFGSFDVITKYNILQKAIALKDRAIIDVIADRVIDTQVLPHAFVAHCDAIIDLMLRKKITLNVAESCMNIACRTDDFSAFQLLLARFEDEYPTIRETAINSVIYGKDTMICEFLFARKDAEHRLNPRAALMFLSRAKWLRRYDLVDSALAPFYARCGRDLWAKISRDYPRELARMNVDTKDITPPFNEAFWRNSQPIPVLFGDHYIFGPSGDSDDEGASNNSIRWNVNAPAFIPAAYKQ